MSTATRSVRVIEVPEVVTSRISREFLQELRDLEEVTRPRFVLDCSAMQSNTPAALDLILGVLEEAMKSNGDVRIAALRPEGKALLANSGASRLFESFATVDQAVNSFRRTTSFALLGHAERNAMYAHEVAA